MSKTFLPSEFMERVVAWPGPDGPGYVNLHWQAPEGRGAGFRGRPFKELQDFMDLAQRASVKPGTFKEIYFCLSTQRTTGKLVHDIPVAHRHAHQATLVKSLWIDVDVKPEKGYPDIDTAMAAITQFCVDADLPAPSAIVYSGGGIHVYWISDKPLTPSEWEPFAHGLRAEIQKHGLKCDAGLTTDIARVLRVPGTFNNKIAKQPRPVTCKWLGDSYDFQQEPRIARLATIVTTTVKSKATATVTSRATGAPFDLSRFPPGKMASLFQGVLDPVGDAISGLNGRSDAPLKLEQVLNGCTHFQDCEVTHGKLHPEPLWQLTLLAASFFEDGRELAYKYSDGYPSYSKDETDAKYDQKVTQKAEGNLGWPSCDAFEAAGAKCKSCPFYKKLRSPLNLAERAVPAPVQGYIAPAPPDDLLLPEGYTTNKEGWISEIVVKTTSNGLTTEEELPLFMCQLRNPVCQGGRRALLCETSLDGKNWGPVMILEVLLATEQSCVKALRECGVKPFPRHQGRIVQFMTSWMTKLDKAKARIQTAPFGWLRDTDGETPIGFAFGGKVFLTDGTEQTAGYTDPQLTRYYMPRGTEHQWHTALKVVTDQKHPALEAIAATSFAAPLMVFTGLYNCVAHSWSPDSGAHKSFSVHIGAGVWGSPKMTKESPTSSPKGIIHKLGEIKNLPVYWDEISDEAKLDQIRPMLGIMTEGGGATNLRQDRTFHVKDEWQTLTLVGANKSLTDNIVRNIKDTDAQLQRVFEFIVEKRGDTINPSDADLLINSLDFNYGHVGLKYAKLLGTKHEDIAKLVATRRRKFDKAVGHKSEERFRSAMATCIYVGAELANAHLGTHFNLPELWEFLREQYLIQRRFIAEAEVVGGSIPNTINATTQFFKAHTRNVLWVRSLPVSKPGKPAAIAFVSGPNREHPDPVHVRMAVTDRVIEISRERFLTYLKNVEQNGSAVLAGLKAHFDATEEAKVSLSAGAGVAGGREHVIRIQVPNTSPFVEDLFKHATIEERLAAGLDEISPVTAPVTDEQASFKKGSEPGQPKPVETGIKPKGKLSGLGAAAEQAAKDLGVVRRGTSGSKDPL